MYSQISAPVNANPLSIDKQLLIDSMAGSKEVGMVYQLQINIDGFKQFLSVSNGATTLLGFTVLDLLSDHEIFWESIDSDDRNGLIAEINDSIKSKQPFTFDFRYTLPNGKKKWLRNHLTAVTESNDGAFIHNGIILDITEQNQTIIDYKEKLYNITISIPGIVYQTKLTSDNKRTVEYINQSKDNIFGIDLRDIDLASPNSFYEAVLDIMHPDDRKIIVKTELEAYKSQTPLQMEYRITHAKSGELRWVRVNSTPHYKDADGNIYRNGIIIDITEQKDAQQAAIEAGEQLHRITDAVPGVVYQERRLVNGSRELTFINQTVSEFYGIEVESSEDIIAALKTTIHPDDIEKERRELDAIFETELPAQVDYRIIRNNEIRWVRSYSRFSHRDEQGLIYRNGIVVDITGEKEAELKIKNQVKTISLIQAVTAAANQAEKIETALNNILNVICEYSDHQIGHAFFVKQKNEDKTLVSSGLWFIQDERCATDIREATQNTEFELGSGLPGQVWQQRKPVWLDSVTKDACKIRKEAYKKSHIKSGFGLPIMVGEQVVAILEFYSTEVIYYKNEYLDMMGQIGVQLGRVFEREQAADERRKLNEQLVSASRFAGMAEVASGVLHNVGNVLNSLNVSAGIAIDKTRESSVSKLAKAIDMLNQNIDNLSVFLTEHDKGKKLLVYLDSLSKQLTSEKKITLDELLIIAENIEHIKAIVKEQQSYAKNTNVNLIETVSINELVEHALNMGSANAEHEGINIIREFSDIPDCITDKHSILQILNNLISNAKHAMKDSSNNKCITLKTELVNGANIRIEIKDTGVGIAKQNMQRLFEYGFTTRKDGHGFGLHSSANTAKKIGGELTCSSEGVGQGAVFILVIPFNKVESIA